MSNSEARDINKLVSSIVAGYGDFGKELSEICYLPDKGSIIEIIEIIRKLLFPGYFDKDNANCSAQREFYTGSLIIQAEKLSQQQICSALNVDKDETAECAANFEKACEFSYLFLKKYRR